MVILNSELSIVVFYRIAGMMLLTYCFSDILYAVLNFIELNEEGTRLWGLFSYRQILIKVKQWSSFALIFFAKKRTIVSGVDICQLWEC